MMTILQKLNLIGAGLLAAQGLALYALGYSKSKPEHSPDPKALAERRTDTPVAIKPSDPAATPPPTVATQVLAPPSAQVPFPSKIYHLGFLLFWSCGCIFMFLYYSSAALPFALPIWANLGVEMVGNLFFCLAAYSLFRGEYFDWRDKALHQAYLLFPVAFIFVIVFGVLVESENVLWRTFYTSPSILLSAGAMLALAIGMFREPSAHTLRFPLLIIFSIYALLQLPAYVFRFVLNAPPEGDPLRMFLFIGKLALFTAFTALALSSAGKRQAESFVSGVRVTVWIFSIAFAVFILFYRVFESLRILA